MQRAELIEQGRRTRAEILAAAAEEFATRDYDAASLADIAAVLGKPKAALRHHFATKADLARAVIETQFAHWTGLVDALAGSGAHGVTALLALLSAAIEESGRTPYARAVIRLVLGRPSEDVLPASLPFSWPDAIRQRLEEARASGELRSSMAVDEVQRLIVDSSFGVFQGTAGPADPAEPEASFGMLWRVVLEGAGATDVDGALRRARAVRVALDWPG